MRGTYAHEATLTMAADQDSAAPGGAVTTALCGHWEHEPPCPLAAHHTSATRDGDRVHLRILFAAVPSDEPEARARIESALAAGAFTGPRGPAEWTLQSSAASEVRPDERAHAERLAD